MDTTFIQPFDRIVIAAYRLPFKLVRKENKVHAFQNSGGLVSAILSLSQKIQDSGFGPYQQKTLWVGKDDSPTEEFRNSPIINENFDITPVNIPDSINDKFYGGFCNDLIWPLFHYFPSLTVFEKSYFDAYTKANQMFFESLKKEIRPGDFIWIHDYQLFLLPALVRESFPDANISFFLHIPFPSFEVFRLLPREWRDALLKGMLGADLVGFHTNDYAQYFLKSVRRCLGYETSLNSIHCEDRIVKADAFPIGIDYAKFSETINTAQTAKYITKIKKQKGNQILIFSVDRLDYTKGFLQRLSAYELFLEKHKNLHGKVIYNMVMVPSRDSISRYQILKKEIEAMVGRINGRFSSLNWRPIIYQYKSLPFNEMIALYNMSDVAFITPMRDGMNLVSKEFIACQQDKPGALILSEMAGASAELGEAIIVNPTDTEEMAHALYKAITISTDEKEESIKKMQERIKNYDVFSWATDIFNSTLKVKSEQEFYKVKYFNSKIGKDIVDVFKKSKNSILFFDYDGTLVPIKQKPELAIPDMHTLELMEQLAKKTKIVIISGRDKNFLDRWFANQPIFLVAEHGAYYKTPYGSWEQEIEPDTSWKDKIYTVLKRYTNRCKGAFIEEKNASLCWHYRNADMDLANLRAIELREELSEIIIPSIPLQILDGHKVIEIKKAGYNKGTAALKLIGKIQYDFILAIGDDKTDEDIFTVLPPHAYTLKVGKEPSHAKFNFLKQTEVISFMNCLLKC
jgi:trehalose 6-phosphate synthase/phosphatase